MTQAAKADNCPLPAVRYSSGTHTHRPDRQQVREIVAEIAAEVLSEVRSGTWHPPTTFRANPRRMSVRTRLWRGPDGFPLPALGALPDR